MADATTMHDVRTTVDLPPALYQRVKELAQRRHQSVSRTVAELTQRGLADSTEPFTIRTDRLTGLPVVDIGRPVTAAEVADLLDEE